MHPIRSKRSVLFVCSLWSAAACGPAVGTDNEGSSGMDGSTSAATDLPTTDPSGGSGSSSASVGSTSGETTANDTSGGESTGVVVPDECDVFSQDCPPGYKCAPYANDGGNAWNDVKCVPVDDEPVGLGESCTAQGSGVSGVDDCDVGMMCFDLDPETLQGECIELCGGSLEEPVCKLQPEAACIVSGDAVLATCVVPCDPLADDCDADELCVPTNDTFLCLPDGAPETGAAGEACEFVNVCDAGLGCLPPAVGVCDDPLGAGCCLPYCSLAAPDCPDGLSCVPWWEEGQAPAGFGDLGACQVPR